MKSVAIVGANELTQHYGLNAETDEVWALGSVYNTFPVQFMTRYFELHPRWMLESDKYKPGHLEKVEELLAPRVPVVWARDYPLRAAFRLCDPFTRGGIKQRVFRSTIDFLIAAALVEDFERIELYGIDMGSSTEHKYQVPSASFWIGLATGRGVEVELPEETTLLRGKVYAYELGAQMISRTNAEQELIDYQNAESDAQQRVNFLNGVAAERQQKAQAATTQAEQEQAVESMQEIATALEYAQRDLYVAHGARQSMERLIAKFDMEEPLELKNRLTVQRREASVQNVQA